MGNILNWVAVGSVTFIGAFVIFYIFLELDFVSKEKAGKMKFFLMRLIFGWLFVRLLSKNGQAKHLISGLVENPRLNSWELSQASKLPLNVNGMCWVVQNPKTSVKVLKRVAEDKTWTMFPVLRKKLSLTISVRWRSVLSAPRPKVPSTSPITRGPHAKTRGQDGLSSAEPGPRSLRDRVIPYLTGIVRVKKLLEKKNVSDEQKVMWALGWSDL